MLTEAAAEVVTSAGAVAELPLPPASSQLLIDNCLEYYRYLGMGVFIQTVPVGLPTEDAASCNDCHLEVTVDDGSSICRGTNDEDSVRQAATPSVSGALDHNAKCIEGTCRSCEGSQKVRQVLSRGISAPLLPQTIHDTVGQERGLPQSLWRTVYDEVM
ncbi:hypothetical protein KFL_006080020 [Klebsormidium nitens]|uniref:Uncharacterized protein n=1 Tax=Klebsormidium nitens TaxID=105231 RepID=A0A1Y1IN32_KLENI|nr:hypothetical protein KFL_006080020 [Klebsormidium nitens]|eukprot:GAQ90166.1 hypothetical protein KFL_006080020 [Klebsormidium nitens]